MAGFVGSGGAHLAGKRRRKASVLRASASKWRQPGGVGARVCGGKWRGRDGDLIGGLGGVV